MHQPRKLLSAGRRSGQAKGSLAADLPPGDFPWSPAPEWPGAAAARVAGRHTHTAFLVTKGIAAPAGADAGVRATTKGLSGPGQ